MKINSLSCQPIRPIGRPQPKPISFKGSINLFKLFKTEEVPKDASNPGFRMIPTEEGGKPGGPLTLGKPKLAIFIIEPVKDGKLNCLV